MPEISIPNGIMNERAMPRSQAVFVLSHQGPNASAGTRAELTSAESPTTIPPTVPSMKVPQTAKKTPTKTPSMGHRTRRSVT